MKGKVIRRSALLSDKFDLDKTEISKHGVKAVLRHGKRLFLDLGRNYLMMHMAMSGSFRTEVRYKEQRHDHLGFELDGGKFVIFSDPRRFCRVELVRKTSLLQLHKPDDFRLGLPYYGMGPDALCPNLTIKLNCSIMNHWRSCLDSSVALKQVLMDQAKIAGIGNIYSDEILFACRINPSTPANSLLPRQVRQLATVTPKMLRLAVKMGGSTFPGANRYHDVYGKEGAFEHAVYGRKGMKCTRCDEKIVSATVGGRTAHWCPNCQPEKQ